MRGVLQIATDNSSKQGHGINHSIATTTSSVNPNDSAYYDSSTGHNSHSSHRSHHQNMEPYLQTLLFNGDTSDSVHHSMRRSMNFMGGVEQDRELIERKPDFSARISSNDSSDLSVLNTSAMESNLVAAASMNSITEHHQHHRDNRISPGSSLPSPSPSPNAVDPIIRSKIVAHPIYPRLVLAYLNCNKVIRNQKKKKKIHQFLNITINY